MKNQKKYSGVITPLLTPTTESGKIDEESVEKLFNFTMSEGTSPFVLGTTGEVAHISYENREALVKKAVQVVDGKSTLYAGIPDNCIENSITAAKKYADMGVEVMVAHLPFFLPLTDDLILKHYETLADNSPAPIIIYNISSITKMSISVEILEKLSEHPNIVGLKDSERDFSRIEKCVDKFKLREDFSLFIGWTVKSVEALTLGFDGIVPNTANVVPALFQSLYTTAIAGDKEKAIQLQAKADLLSALVQGNKTMTRTIPELKAIGNHLGICKPFVLPPLEKLSDEESAVLIKEFTSLEL